MMESKNSYQGRQG